jgi:histidinol phosphatase-like PHP family hydrolase
MIDLHTHTLLSDGELLPSELVRRAQVAGYKAIGLTDHVDSSNIDFILPRIVKVCKALNKVWDIIAIPGVELTHVPLEDIRPLVKFAKKNGAKIVIVHGETVSEPVIPGTNRRAIEAGCTILAHPGRLKREDAKLAAKRGVYLELTAKKSHMVTNKQVFRMAKSAGAKLILNTDAHSENDLLTPQKADRILTAAGLGVKDKRQVFASSSELVRRLCKG